MNEQPQPEPSYPNWFRKFVRGALYGVIACICAGALLVVVTVVVGCSETESTGSIATSPPATRAPLPTPARIPVPSSQQISDWIDEISVITLWFTLSVEATQLCVLAGDIDWNDYDDRVDKLARDMVAIADDAADGSLDRYSAVDIDRTIANANRMMREIERKCGF